MSDTFIEQAIHHYVAIKHLRCFEDLNDEEQIHLLRSAMSEGFGSYDKIKKFYSEEDLQKFEDGTLDDQDLMHDMISDLSFCFENDFNKIFEELYEMEYGTQNNISVSGDYGDPIASDRRDLVREHNYFVSMHNIIFK